MGAKRAERVKVLFHRRGEDVETAWCEPVKVAGRRLYRLDNILFVHSTPVCGDVIEASPSAKFDGALTFRRIVEPCGRYTMIVEYSRAAIFQPLQKLLAEELDVKAEGCFAPRGKTPGRVYLAVPAAVVPAQVLELVSARFPGVAIVDLS
jgi:hypothetical protein